MVDLQAGSQDFEGWGVVFGKKWNILIPLSPESSGIASALTCSEQSLTSTLSSLVQWAYFFYCQHHLLTRKFQDVWKRMAIGLTRDIMEFKDVVHVLRNLLAQNSTGLMKVQRANILVHAVKAFQRVGSSYVERQPFAELNHGNV